MQEDTSARTVTREGQQPEPRGARRKRRTRAKLMRAALQLMAEKGMNGVAVNEITETADVGFGSFYNHFDSKAALHEALVAALFDSFGSALEQIVETVEDPAEVLSASIRCTLRKATSDPEWGRFLTRTGFASQLSSHGLGHHLKRDLERGVASGRFRVNDMFMAVMITGGAVLAAISAELEGLKRTEGTSYDAAGLDFDTRELPERTSEAILRALGVAGDEAQQIARRPLPAVDFSSELF